MIKGKKHCLSPLHKGPTWLWIGEFYVKVWGDDSKEWPAQTQAICKTCTRLVARVRIAKAKGRSEPYGAKTAGQSAEERKRKKRERYKIWIAGVDKHGVANRIKRRNRQRSYQRDRLALKRRAEGVAVRGPWLKYRNRQVPQGMMDATRFLEWWDEVRTGEESNNVARSIHRIRQQEVVSVDLVDRMGCYKEDPGLLDRLMGEEMEEDAGDRGEALG